MDVFKTWLTEFLKIKQLVLWVGGTSSSSPPTSSKMPLQALSGPGVLQFLHDTPPGTWWFTALSLH